MTKYILITHQKGGVGKSTLIFNLAQNLCKEAKVLVADLDLQGSLSQISNMVTDFEITNDLTVLNKVNDFDFIFIDTPPYLSNELPKLIELADLIIVPTKAGALDLLAIDSTLKMIDKSGRLNHTMIVFNMVKPNTKLTQEVSSELKSYNTRIAKTQISDLVAFTRSVLIGGVTTENKPQRQIDNLTKEVLTALI